MPHLRTLRTECADGGDGRTDGRDGRGTMRLAAWHAAWAAYTCIKAQVLRNTLTMSPRSTGQCVRLVKYPEEVHPLDSELERVVRVVAARLGAWKGIR